MTTILRVKRSSTEPPLDSLMLSFHPKRQKLDLADDLNVQVLSTETVAQFAGTLKDPNDDIVEHLSKILPDYDAKRGIKRTADTDLSCIIERISKLAKQESTKDKYKVISCQPLTTVSEENSHKWTTLVEIENCLNIDTVHQNVKNEDIHDYVYDLYCAQTDMCFEQNDLSVRELLCLNSDEFEDEIKEEDEDSNAESNPRNDYPDSDYDIDIDNDDFALFDERSDLYGDETEDDQENNGMSYCYYRKVTKHYHSDTSDDEIDEYKRDRYDDEDDEDDEWLED